MARSNVDIHAFLKARLDGEFRFFDGRQWKFDFVDKTKMIAIEIEGGIFSKGRHTRSTGYLGDMEKYNTAQRLGWKVYRYAPWQFEIMIEEIGAEMGWMA